METKHTKGEWSIHKDQFNNNNIICNGYYLGEARNETDAKLIAASPLMYEYIIEQYNNGCEKAKKLLTNAKLID